MESQISDAYLRALIDQYSGYFHEYDTAPILIINTERLNPIDDDEDFAVLLRQLNDLRGRRNFFSVGD